MVNLTNSNKSARGIRLNGQVTSPSPPQSAVVKSPRKLNSMHVASDGLAEDTIDRSSRKRRKAIQFSISPNSKRFWTKDEELVILKEAVTNDEPENKDGSAKGDSCDEKFPYEDVDKLIEKVAARNESEELGADDELGTLQDALETTVFQHLGNQAKKLMVKNLRTLGATERKELSGEWKALLVEEMLLKGKKHSFAAKLANEAIASSARDGN